MKYTCSVCGYIYDEEKEGVPFSQLSDDWLCPVCRAGKNVFVPETVHKAEKASVPPMQIDPDAQKLSPGAMAALFSNLARGCEKQYKPKEQELFTELAEYFTAAAPEITDGDEKLIAKLLDSDLQKLYPEAKATAETHADRGSQRICVWGEKVTRMLQSILSQYEKEGDAFLKDTNVWVCTVCGFIYIDDNAPQLCPVCKVPDWKFEKMEGRM